MWTIIALDEEKKNLLPVETSVLWHFLSLFADKKQKAGKRQFFL